jgi:hypothetical protein
VRGAVTENQRGFLYRLFAYHGGPLVLDAMVSGMAPQEMPKRIDDVAEWFDDALGQIVRSRAAAAARVIELNKYNVIGLLKLALGGKRVAKTVRTGTKSARIELDQYAEKIVAKLDWGLANRTPPVVDETRQPYTTSPVVPRAEEQLAMVADAAAASKPMAS